MLAVVAFPVRFHFYTQQHLVIVWLSSLASQHLGTLCQLHCIIMICVQVLYFLHLFYTDCHTKSSCVCLPPSPPADLVYWGIHLQCWQEVHKALLTRLSLCVTVHLLLHSHLAGSAPVLRSAGPCYGDASEWTGADRRPAVGHL